MFENKRTPPKIFQPVDDVKDADEIGRLSCADVLRNRGRPVALFTPALLITHGGFDRDPVVEFNARFPAEKDMRPFCVDLTREHEFFFSGLGAGKLPRSPREVNWDKRLYAIDADRKTDCFEFIGGIAFSDPKRGFFASTFSYEIYVPDPTAKRLDFLSVTVFGVLANTFVAMLQPNVDKPPTARKIPAASQSAAAQFLYGCGIIAPSCSDDPLNQRDL